MPLLSQCLNTTCWIVGSFLEWRIECSKLVLESQLMVKAVHFQPTPIIVARGPTCWVPYANGIKLQLFCVVLGSGPA